MGGQSGTENKHSFMLVLINQEMREKFTLVDVFR